MYCTDTNAYMYMYLWLSSNCVTDWRGRITRGKLLLHVTANLFKTHKVYPQFIPCPGSLEGELTCVLPTAHELGIRYPLPTEDPVVSVTNEEERGVVGTECVSNLFQEGVVCEMDGNRQVTVLRLEV